MKVFFLSFPFDLENSGDYDYCKTLTTAITNRGSQAQYVIGKDIKGYDSEKARELIESVSGKRNAGGKTFYDSLTTFYNDKNRKDLTSLIKEYFIQNKAENKNVVNLQLRPPETGFLFSVDDLTDLQSNGFKICITCHEYKLNYDRKWLQTILHSYFQVADIVFFFNKKDMSNADKHAKRSVFLDDFLPNLQEQDSRILLHGFSSQSHSTMSRPSTEGFYNLIVTKQEFTKLECEKLVGELKYLKGPTIKCNESGHKAKLTPPFTLEWGVRKDLEISIEASKQESRFFVSGVIINLPKSEETTKIKDKINSSFLFNHDEYDLISKSRLTKVPPTTADVDNTSITSCLEKPANIVIFGLIREGKGYEDAMRIIKEIHDKKVLPSTRLIIVGKPDSLKLLAEIINEKFDAGKVTTAEDKKSDANKIITEDLLSKVLSLAKIEEIDNIANTVINSILNHKLGVIKSSLVGIKAYSVGIENIVLEALMASKIRSESIKVTSSSNLQKFISKMEEKIPESLPIDIFLDVAAQDLSKIFARAKYAIKYDEKGWANNASGLINLLAYGCVLYTSWGMCTDKEVTKGDYKGAIVLPSNKYCLKQGEHLSPDEEGEGKRKFFTTHKKIPEKKNLITPEIIIDDIIAREANINNPSPFLITGNNKDTFDKANLLLCNSFLPSIIADKMIGDLHNLFEESDHSS